MRSVIEARDDTCVRTNVILRGNSLSKAVEAGKVDNLT